MGYNYGTSFPAGQACQFLTTPQAIRGGSVSYQVLRPVNFDPVQNHLSSGQALVYQAQDMACGRLLAVKQPLPDHAERFERECCFLLGPHRHPNIVRGVERMRDGQEQFLVMEWVEGETLSQEIDRRRWQPDHEVAARLLILSQVLHFVNCCGYYFRDLNEANGIVPTAGLVPLVVIDFGGIEPIGNKRPTQLLPPSPSAELYRAFTARKRLVYTPQTEVYALCQLVYLMATGRPVPDDRDVYPLEPPRALNPSISPEIEGILLRGLDVYPGKRPASPREVGRQIATILGARGQIVVTPAHHPAHPAGGVPPVPGAPVPAASSSGIPSSLLQAWEDLMVAAERQATALIDGMRRQPAIAMRWISGGFALLLLMAVLGHSAAEQAGNPDPAAGTAEDPSASVTQLKPEETAAAATSLPAQPPAAPAPTAAAQPPEPPVADGSGGELPRSPTEHHAEPPPGGEPAPAPVPVLGQHVHLRGSPDMGGAVYGEISSPKTVTVLSTQGGWCRVRASDGTEDWIWGAYVPLKEPYSRGTMSDDFRIGGYRLPAGDRALLRRDPDGTLHILSPNGGSAAADSAPLAL